MGGRVGLSVTLQFFLNLTMGISVKKRNFAAQKTSLSLFCH
ncbi:hypothetical protein SAMN04487828_2132 [Prevotella sp. lc2012]|nr:hypothetical protein SAMN04487828_2132 [Prevotella sp. lc2012]